MEFSWLRSKHQLHKHWGLTQRRSKPDCSSSGEDDQVKHELCFPSWGCYNWLVWCIRGIWFGRYILSPSPLLPGLLSDARTESIALKCKDWGPEFLLGELTQSYVHPTGSVTHISHYFKSQPMLAQPLTKKGISFFLKLAKKVLLIISTVEVRF